MNHSSGQARETARQLRQTYALSVLVEYRNGRRVCRGISLSVRRLEDSGRRTEEPCGDQGYAGVCASLNHPNQTGLQSVVYMAQNAFDMGCLTSGLAGVCKASNTDIGVIAAVEIYKRTATNPMKREDFPHRKARI